MRYIFFLLPQVTGVVLHHKIIVHIYLLTYENDAKYVL
jgi:succinate dehydrogenase hydrophobic anchor subunit